MENIGGSVNTAVILTEMDDTSLWAKITGFLKQDAGDGDIYNPEQIEKFVDYYEQKTGRKVEFNCNSDSASVITIASWISDAQFVWQTADAIIKGGYLCFTGNEDEGGKYLRDFGF